MLVHNVEQRSPEWFAARIGIPTASCFDKIISPSGKASTQADAYANTLIAEWLTGLPGGMEPNEWMQRGTEMEPEAFAFYAMDADVSQVGFVTTDDGMVGCSPDGIVGTDGLLEIKCPAPHTHVSYMLGEGVPSKYIPQIQGQIYVCERDWCDFLSYHPAMPPVLVRVWRDQKYIDALAGAMSSFLELLRAKKAKMIDAGHMPANGDK